MVMELRERIERCGDALAIAEPGATCDYRGLLQRVDQWSARLHGSQIPPGAIVSLEGEYGSESIAAFVALVMRGVVVVPLSSDSRAHRESFLEIAEVEWRVTTAGGSAEMLRTGCVARHSLYGELRKRPAPGLVLFSSGSTGVPKAACHDLARLLLKFEVPRHRYRTLVFLQLDHIGGVNTLFYTLYNGGAVVVPADRSPRSVAEAIATHRVELLPTSPTFLNLLLLSDVAGAFDLSSLRLITYGTEPMPASTLARAAAAFPDARLLQTYGLTEVGILRSKSRGDDSLWVKVGGEGYETKIVDGRLWVRAESAMLGYLNAPSPFDADGFFDTGDRVEIDGDWVRILGRESEIINVGGSKVYPAEVEGVILQMPGVADAVVFGEPNSITGQLVSATVVLSAPESLDDLKARVRRFCAERLPAFKVPARVRLAEGPLHSARYKRMRGGVPGDSIASPGL